MRRPVLLFGPSALALALSACTASDGGKAAATDSSTDAATPDSGEPTPFSYPEPEAMPPWRGPAGPAVSFGEEQLFVNCARLDGGERSFHHHNLVTTYRGHLVLPWAPEFGQGGLSFFDMSDPCSPVKVGEGFHERMRESHAIGFLHLPEGEPHAGDYAVVTGILGIQMWDLSVLETPEMINYLEIEGVLYPDAYARVVLSVFWQHPWLYVAGADNGIYVLNTEDPRNPELVTTLPLDGLRAGGIFALGDLLMVTAAEGAQVQLLDIGDPANPQPIPGGRFTLTDQTGESVEAYHANLSGDLALFARKEGGGGFIAWDISDPTNPTYRTEGYTTANGGYVFYDEGYIFVGDSDIAHIFDARDLDAVELLGTGDIPGDLDTITPYGNVAVLSVDDDAEDNLASAVMPWSAEPDTTPPAVMRIRPVDGATGVAPTARIGVGLTEFVEPSSVFAGSIRLWHEDGSAVDGWGSGQEAIASFAPKEPLEAGVTYTVEVMAGGLRDLNNNALAETVTTSFTVAGGR
jgi:hypothetical protein